MKQYLVIFALLVWAAASMVRAEDPDGQYVRIYNLIQQADDLSQSGQRRAAYDKYQEAQAALKGLSLTNPDWNPKLVQFRLNYVVEKLAPFGSTPAEATAPSTSSNTNVIEKPLIEKQLPERTAVEGPTATSLKPADAAAQIQALRDENKQLSATKAELDAKLREALSAQPATVDPREFAKAEEKIRNLQKENELLKVTLQQEQAKVAKAGDTTALETAQKSLADANQKLAQQTQMVAALTQEKEVLQARLKSVVPDAQVQQLKAENEGLKKQVADLKTAKAPAVTVPSAPLSAAEQKAAARAEAKQIKQLEQERDDLKKKLAAANLAATSGKNKKDATQWAQLTNQINTLQAKLSALEAAKVPLTAEESALLKAPNASPVTTRPPEETPAQGVKKTMNDVPVGAGTLVAEASRAFKEGKFDEAETKYKQVLSMDEKNVYTLGNLAAIQLERGSLDDAEKNLKQALAIEPNDAFNLSLWGILKFRQDKMTEAQTALSRSAQLDPNNAETQNYLGITLSESGFREAGEAALRKAIKLNPDYAGAHHNLAVVYATQEPPFLELAKYHYQKALAKGFPKNAKLEKMLEGKK